LAAEVRDIIALRDLAGALEGGSQDEPGEVKSWGVRYRAL
jgi:hypothetical protein